MIDKLSTKLKPTVPYYVTMTNGVIVDINCNPLVEFKIVLLCREARLVSEDLTALFLIGLPNNRSETE